MKSDTKPVILAVDDAPANLDIMIGILSDQYRIKVATSGEKALSLALNGSPPDLILLDILMPGMDGVEVCRALKEHKHLQEVPVIFISSLEDVHEKVKAFTSGGVDYVTKPFQPEELLARVNTHLTLRKVQQQLENQNSKLDELVRRKSRELSEAHDRLDLVARTKGEFLKLISHELRTPANGILGIADAIFDSCSDSEEAKELRPYFEESRDRMISVLEDSLLLARVNFSQKDFKSVSISMGELLSDIYLEVSKFAREHDVKLGPMPAYDTLVEGDPDLFKMALETLLMTAVLFSSRQQEVKARIVDGESSVTLVLETTGSQLEEAIIECFFELSSSVRNSTRADILSLKPVLAERIISLYGGFVLLRNLNSTGIGINVTMKKCST